MDLPKTVSDAIEVDVLRSFNSMKTITQENMNNILKSYAIVNKHLDYCQGMNFIAGFLFLTFSQSEAHAFAVMKALIQKHRMHEMFNTELPMLKLNFYQLDRLIAILLPDLHMHFKVNPILPTNQSSSRMSKSTLHTIPRPTSSPFSPPSSRCRPPSTMRLSSCASGTTL